MNQYTVLVYSCKPLPFFGKLSAHFFTCSQGYNKSTARQVGKVFSKLLGNRASGSKKRWFENPTERNLQSPLDFHHLKRNDQSTTRRATVLNKLFMTHITDLLATGEASPKILGKGLQITGVKVSHNIQCCNVYWVAKGDAREAELEDELKKCGGILRHELSQLCLIGEVPRIYFVKDKAIMNLAKVETVLKACDFGTSHKLDCAFELKNDLYHSVKKGEETTEIDGEEPLPEMRLDLFGLDHRAVMGRILTKMKKSENAWKQHSGCEVTEDVIWRNTQEKLKLSKRAASVSENEKCFNNVLGEISERKRVRERKRRHDDFGDFYRKMVEGDHNLLDDKDFIDDDYDETK